MKTKLILFLLFIGVISFAQTKGTITGTLTDKDANNATLPFANAAIKGSTIGTQTDENGKYSLSVAAGNYTLVLSFLGYENVEVPVNVKAGETITVNRALGSGSYKLEDVVVKATGSREKETALLLDQKKAVEIKQSIGAQEMARKGVSNVQEGLTKITGVSKTESRGLFVRGLEERYNNLLINDLQAPSNSPFKKIIPLDLFPTDIVGVLNVYKTFNPNIPGDFAGATINIETSQPRASLTKISTSLGYTTNNNGRDFLISEDANTTQGFLGLLQKDRELPAAFGGVPSGKILTPEQYNSSSKQNSWDVDNSTSPINSGIGFLHTEKFSLDKNRSVSYIFSLNAENKYQVLEGIDRTFNQGQGNYDNNFKTSKYNYTTSLSGLAGVKYKSERFDVAFNSFLLRSTSSTIQDQLGYKNSLNTNPNVLIRLNQFEETKYWNNQILANYKLTANGKHALKGGFSMVKTTYNLPDRKVITGEKINENEIITTYGADNLIRQYFDVSGNRFFSGMLEYAVKLKEKDNGKDTKLTLGYNGMSHEEISSYRFVFGRPLLANPFTVEINNISETIQNDVANGLVKFTEESTGDWRSKLYQNVQSGYANLFLNVAQKWDINGGIRVEQSLREIKYRQTGDAFDANYRKLKKDKVDVLPSLNVKYAVTEKNNLRFAASKTITRPTSIEILPVNFVNPDGTVEIGNSKIENSDNLNFDLKYEMFPENNQLFVVGLFGKQIQNPIERIFIPTASSGGQIITYANSKSALLYGVELEMILPLNKLSAVLNNFSWGFNTSIMKSEVKVDRVKNPLENSSSRALQGASNWLVNSDLKYEFKFNEDMKNTISLVYGVAGERIYAVGTAGIDHIYEKPFHKLDFVWSSKLSKNIEAKLAIDNILNPSFKRELGDESQQTITESDLTVREFKRGTGFSLGINYTF
ncbi:TonB-dependent receptor [Flavobacterium sp. CYK-4]|uniref:TonB-dependent receptor n=1 Tax=Flavobacterium lotistagni TaxID=2709660 RepID=UPI00140A4F2A|nr:TonB-dependent receptor [Flavobacterium lotistagni]NHM06695.1 TonB-dependent receptor [Flavobacterium lotistagni]